MAKKPDPTPTRTCDDCFHCPACHLWSSGAISPTVAPKRPQFEPARYVTLAELHEMHQMAKGELVPVKHGRWVYRMDGWYFSACKKKAMVDAVGFAKYCCRCGAKMDATDNNVAHKDGCSE